MGADAQMAMQEASRQAARTLEDLADIINFTLEELVRQRFELPAFSVLHRTAQNARATINREYQGIVCNRLTEHSRQRLEALLTRAEDETKSPWNLLKNEPKQPTSQNNKRFSSASGVVARAGHFDKVFEGIPDIKVKQFAAEARSLDVASMNDLTANKRLTLAAALVLTQTARAGSCNAFTTMPMMLF